MPTIVLAQSLVEYGGLASADVSGPWARLTYTLGEVSPQTWMLVAVGVLLLFYVFRAR